MLFAELNGEMLKPALVNKNYEFKTIDVIFA